jgi:hypothetical protein
MTDGQLELVHALGRCSLGVWTRKKSFMRSMEALAERAPATPLTPKQAEYLYRCAWHFRRQLPERLVMATMLTAALKVREIADRPTNDDVHLQERKRLRAAAAQLRLI